MTRKVFMPTRGSDQRIRPADPTLRNIPAFCPKAYLVPTLNKTGTHLVLYSNIKIPLIYTGYTHVRIHPYSLQPGHTYHYYYGVQN